VDFKNHGGLVDWSPNHGGSSTKPQWTVHQPTMDFPPNHGGQTK